MLLGWKQRFFAPTRPALLPFALQSHWWEGYKPGLLPFLLCLFFTYAGSLLARLLETPFWLNPDYKLGDEFLLATHDAYHWVAGAEGFEFGVGHPMSVFLAFLASQLGEPPAVLAFWLPPYISALLAVAVFFWGWGLGRPYAGMCAGILACLSPAFFGRTQLGFYDTDFVVLLFAVLIGLVPALWLHPWLKNIPDSIAQQLVRRDNKNILGGSASSSFEAHSKSCVKYSWLAKLTVSLRRVLHMLTSPFRKLFGPFLNSFAARFAPSLREKAFSPQLSLKDMEASMLSFPWLLALSLSGLFGHWAQQWHSFFPYYIRFSALLIPVLILFLGPIQGRRILLRGGLVHALALLAGFPGFILALTYALILLAPVKYAAEPTDKVSSYTLKGMSFLKKVCRDDIALLILWAVILVLCIDTTVISIMKASFLSYVHRDGDMASGALLSDPVIFPSVNQSILETQTISFIGGLLYCYPSEILILLSLVAVVVRLIKTPVLIWFLPLLGLHFLGSYMGGRMAMFGPPVLALCACLEGGSLFSHGWKAGGRLLGRVLPEMRAMYLRPWARHSCLFLFSVLVSLYLVWPLILLIPSQSQIGPILSKEQASALKFLRTGSPEESIIWNWWDWGYATHHFAHRHTIADGARHGGPSLYLPAAVYTTADPRFARQIIKYTALKGNVPGNVFSGLTAAQAQQLMVDLGNKEKPLISAPGKQYLVVSYDIVTIGAWISNYGSWNFAKKKMSTALLSDISPNDVQFNSDTGILMYQDINPNTGQERRSTIQAASITLFSPAGLSHSDYALRDGGILRQGNHFIFDIREKVKDIPAEYRGNWHVRFWENLFGGPLRLYSAATNKLFMDPVFYNTLMVQLLISPKDDKRFSPYFRCVYDNTYARVYEVL